MDERPEQLTQADGSGTAAPLLEADPGTGEITINTATLDANLATILGERPQVSLRVVDGSPQGVAVSGVRASFYELGLRDGDVVTLVNGVSLVSIDSAVEALQLYGSVRTAPELEVQLLRNGEPLTLRFHLR